MRGGYILQTIGAQIGRHDGLWIEAPGVSNSFAQHLGTTEPAQAGQWRAQLTAGRPYELPPEIRTMAMQAQDMVKQCLDAVVNRDPALARRVREEDDAIDAARQRVQRRVMQGIKDDPESVECLLRINSVSKHIERIADMATNIAEDVVYMVEGDIVRHRTTD